MIHLHNSAKLTKQELENINKVTPFIKWKKLMEKAMDYKKTYLLLKSKTRTGLSEDNLNALDECIIYERESALEYYNKAEKLKKENPHIIEYINKMHKY